MIIMGPYTTTGVREVYLGNMAFSSVDLIITDTATASVYYDAGSGVMAVYNGMFESIASQNGAYLPTIHKIFLDVVACTAGSVTLYISGLRDSK